MRSGAARAPALVALLTLGLASAAALAAHEGNRRQEASELDQRVAIAREVISGGFTSSSSAMYSAAQWAPAGLTHAELLGRIRGQTGQNDPPAMAIVEFDGPRGRIIRSVAGRVRLLHTLADREWAVMRRASGRRDGGFLRMAGTRRRPILLGFVPLPSRPLRAVYAEIDVWRTLPPEFARLAESVDFAAYAAPLELPALLIASNAERLPLTGDRRTTVLDIAGVPVTLVVVPRRPFVGALARAMPWLLFGAGVVLAGVLATLVAALGRRRDQALGLVASLEATSAELEDQALRDVLTGLGNRRLLTRESERAAAGPSPRHAAMILVDLDDFKTVNDSLGHLAGDELLRRVGRRIVGAAAGSGLCVRLGGDEFAVLVSGDGAAETAMRVARAIRAALSTPFDLRGRPILLRPSIGLASAADGAGHENLLRDADIAMYSAKAARSGELAVFAPEMLERVRERHELASDLDHAVARGEIVVRFQPILAFDDGAVAMVEALARWRHPTRGELCGDDFIGLAEELDRITGIGGHVLDVATRCLARWRTVRPDIRLAVNVSPVELRDPGLVDRVGRSLTAAGVPADALVLEITERALVEGEGVDATLRGLRDLGVALALDDFGAGFSSLEYLRRLPLDIVKLDRALLARPRGARDTRFIEAVAGFARHQSLQTVVEGIESSVELETAREAGFDFGQGMYLGAPAPASVIALLLASASVASAEAASAPPVEA